MASHAYINIEPNNGGIVLNVSDGGLCFHSFDPVRPNGTIRFWFSDNHQRIEAAGTVTWTDETQKGGMRFTDMPAEARDKIRAWMNQPRTPDHAPASVGPRPRALPVGTRQLNAAFMPGGSAPPAVLSSELQAPRPWSAFSRGLATGLLVSAVAASAFLFHNYRRELGESLIRLGERFAAKPQAETTVVSAAAPDVSPEPAKSLATAPVSVAPQTVSSPTPTEESAPRAIPAHVPVPAPQPEKLAQRPMANTANSQPAPVGSVKIAMASPAAVVDRTPKAPAAPAAPAISLPHSTIPVPIGAPSTVASSANLSPPKLGPASKVAPAKPASVQSEESGADNVDFTRELYFDVGKFKNQLQAHDETNKLAQLGFPVTAVQKGFLWTNSYHVLVGPYGDEGKAKVTQDTLVSSGFKPRPFEKGWRTFTLVSSLTLNGARTPEGDYTISWESYIGNANVKFTRNNNVVASADGKWVKRDAKYPRDAYVYRRNPDGSRTLLEIHFGGMRQALVFGKAS